MAFARRAKLLDDTPVSRETYTRLVLMLESFPALQHVVMPGTAGDVLIQVVIAGGDNVEAGAGLVGNDDSVGVGELLAEPGVHHGRVQGPAPGVHIIPPRARPGTGHGPTRIYNGSKNCLPTCCRPFRINYYPDAVWLNYVSCRLQRSFGLVGNAPLD